MMADIIHVSVMNDVMNGFELRWFLNSPGGKKTADKRQAIFIFN
jgi:hypothetical protein